MHPICLTIYLSLANLGFGDYGCIGGDGGIGGGWGGLVGEGGLGGEGGEQLFVSAGLVLPKLQLIRFRKAAERSCTTLTGGCNCRLR